MKTYYQKHRAKLRAYQAAWARAHPASRKRHRRDYYLRNCVALRAKARAYYWAHREDRLAYAHERRTNNAAVAHHPPQAAGSAAPCETCQGTGWYGDNGPGIVGNREAVRCDCGAVRCTIGTHSYVMFGNVPWCATCNREADLSVCRLNHPLPNAQHHAEAGRPIA